MLPNLFFNCGVRLSSGASGDCNNQLCLTEYFGNKTIFKKKPCCPLVRLFLAATCWNSRFGIETMCLDYFRNTKLTGMNNLIQRVSYPFVKAFPGVSCGSGYFGMYAGGNA